MTDLHIDVESTGAYVVVRIEGEIDILTAPSLRDDLTALLGERPIGSQVVLDLSGVRFLAVAGARALAEAEREARRLGISLALGATSPSVELILRLTGMWDDAPERQRV